MVNPAITAALIAASRKQEVQDKIEQRLKKAKAVTRARAVALDLGKKEQELVDQAVASGTVQRTEDGRLYLNERAMADRTEGQGLKALLIILVIASVLASVVAFVATSGR